MTLHVDLALYNTTSFTLKSSDGKTYGKVLRHSGRGNIEQLGRSFIYIEEIMYQEQAKAYISTRQKVGGT